jgi:branched-chain amino acid transport system permease protein
MKEASPSFLKKRSKKLLQRFARGGAASFSTPREADQKFFGSFFQKRTFFPAALLLCAALPLFGGNSDRQLGLEFAATLTLATLWNLLAGYAGVVSIGQQAFVGLGGYLLFALVVFAGVPALAAVPVAAAACGVIAIPSARLLFRLRGPFFAIGSWVLAEVFRLSFAQISSLGGGSGMSLPIMSILAISHSRPDRLLLFYCLSAALALAATALVVALLKSRFGLGLTAIRDAEPAAASLGVDVMWLKQAVYIIVAAVAGLTGALLFLQNIRISPDSAFSVNDWTANIIFIVVIGGIGRLEGPLIGCLVFFGFRAAFADFGPWYLIGLGLLAIAMMLLAPSGIAGLLAKKSN